MLHHYVIMGKYYAVANGRSTGVFNNWSDCKASVNGYSNASFKSFSTQAEATAFANSGSSSSGGGGGGSSYSGPSYSSGYSYSSYSGGGSSYGSSRSGAVVLPIVPPAQEVAALHTVPAAETLFTPMARREVMAR